MERVWNFSAGPSVLPVPVLEKAQKELLCYGTSGMSVMEMSHRSKVYIEIFETAERLVKELMNVPENYKVLFLQGGAWSQFSMVPMNLMKTGNADYVNTGDWAKKALGEAGRYGKVNVVATSEDRQYVYIPKLDKAKFNPNADYFHITTNNTIYGTRYTSVPDTGNVPLVADMSSNIMSEVYDVSKFGLIYAGAQKNLGPAGVTLVIVREDLIGETMEGTPTMFKYKTHAEAGSMFNTPPTYGIYVMKLVLGWIKSLGGVPAVQKMNEEKAAVLYNYLDESKLFRGTVEKNDRSLMNATFVTGNEDLDNAFCKECDKNGIANIKGYRTVGGMRASMYNALPIEGVKALVDLMKKFETANK